MTTQDKTDMRSWKKVLLQWIVECGFTERNYFNIEQSDLELFYKKFSEHHSGAQRFEKLNAFLQNYYPEFKPHLDDENSLSSTDYIYIYSLLLHYSCVKQPEEYFHEICQKLSPHYQQNIATFFNRLIDAETFNKEYLRQVIANVAANQITPPTSSNGSSSSGNASVNSSNGNSGNGNASGVSLNCSSISLGVTRIEGSPMKTPIRHGASVQRISPSTPKTFLLEERTRELYNLRAQLETERYEKGLLEVQIKQNEEKILKLNQDHRKLQQQIKDLKNDILTRNSEQSPSSNRDGNENQTKRRLYKDIAQKEEEISKLTELLNSMREEKNLVNEKLLYAQKQIIICMERIKELDYKVDELTAELDQKNDTIRSLQESKMDLEHFIAEMRSASHSRLDDTSIDCPDMSFTRGTNSSSNMSSPENLGCSVVDIQLREKQLENSQLREELSALRMNNTRLSQLMQQRTDQLCEEFNMQRELLADSDDANTNMDPTQFFITYVDCIDQLGKCYKNERNITCKMRNDMEQLQLRNDELCNRVQAFEVEIKDLKHNVENLAERNEVLEQSKREMSARIAEFSDEIQLLSEQKFRLVSQLDTLASEYSCCKDKYMNEKAEQDQLIEKLENELTTSKESNTTIHQTNVEIKQQLDALQQRNSEQENALKALSDRLAQQQMTVEEQKSGSQLVKEKHEKLLVQCEQLKRARRESDEHLESMRNQLAVKEMEMGSLGTEIADVRQLNVELEQRINDLIKKCNLEKQTSDATINKRDEHIKQINNECMQLQSALQEAKAINAKAMEELRVAKQQMKAISVLFQSDKMKIQPELELDLAKELEVIGQRVKELQEHYSDATSKIKCLELRNTETSNKLLDTERLLQRTRTEHDERVQRLHDDRVNITESHTKAIHQLENELRVSMERYVAKEQELRNAITQHNEVQQQLNATTQKFEKLDSEHSRLSGYLKRIRSLEEKIDDYAADNAKFMSELMNEEAFNVSTAQPSDKPMSIKHSEYESVLMSLEAKLDSVMQKNNHALQQLMETAIQHEQQLSDLNESHTQLEADLAAKETELRIALDEQQQERDDWQSKLSQLMRKLAEQSVKQEAYDLAITEITDTLENNICSENSYNEQNPLFDNKVTTETSTTVRRLRQTLNKVANRQNALTNENCDLAEKLRSQKTELEELQEIVASEKHSLNSQLSQEINRLNNELQTLTAVNQQLTEECDALQMRTVELEKQVTESEQQHQTNKLRISEKCDELKMRTIELEKQLAKAHEQHETEKRLISEKCDELKMRTIELEKQLAKAHEQHETEKRLISEKCDELKLRTVELEKHLAKAQEQHQTEKRLISEKCDELKLRTVELEKQLAKEQEQHQADELLIHAEQQKCITVQKEHAQCEAQLQKRQKELQRVHELLEKQQCTFDQFTATAKRLDECEKQRHELANEHKFMLNEVARLKGELETTSNEYTRSVDELKECKQERQRANENITQLIQQIGSIRQEKEAVVEERELLRKQLDETGRTQTICETRIKGIIERSQSLERQLLTAENEVKSMRAQLINIEQKNERLAAENNTLRETQSQNENHLQRLTSQINEVQSGAEKFEHELTEKNLAFESLQKKHDALVVENEMICKRLANVESAHEQCDQQKIALEQEIVQLKSSKKKLEASEFDAKSKLSKLEKGRDACDDKLRKLNGVLSNVEATNVRLTLEIGALNSQLQEAQSEVSAARTKHEERILQLTAETTKLREEQQLVCEKLEQTSNALQIAEQKCNKLAEELQQINSELLITRAEKSHVEEEHKTTCDKLAQHQAEQQTQTAVVTSLEERIVKLEAELIAKNERIYDLENEIDKLRSQYESNIAALTENQTKNNNDGLDALRTKLNVAETMLDKEQQITAQLRLDNQILQAKYRELKQHLQTECKSSEERVKETRLELEGKLDKMKNKMKTLYAEEMKKLQSKHERDTANLKSEIEVSKAQNLKYEEHTRKLSSQIVRLNDQILEQQKQNAILTTKLKHLQEEEDYVCGNRRGSSLRQLNSTHISTNSNGHRLTSAASAVNSENFGSTNIKMEDEEGEIFNNTYLTDLKLGRMPDYMNRDVRAEELQYRNSLLPPHLKSTYAAQYDHGLPEDELKDGCLNILDDSTSALLSATSTGATRKKTAGATHYKRPGPPTPSKNGGRLSLGYNSEQPREILKETYETGNNGISSAVVKTPARFNFFSSRFSLGGGSGSNNGAIGGGGAGCGGGAGAGIKDEVWPRRVEVNLRRTLQRRNFQILFGDAICTSTPRKSKEHFDQRRLLDQLLSSSPSPSPLAAIVPTTTLEGQSNLGLIVTPVTLQARSIAPPPPPVSPIKVARRRSRRSSLMAIMPSTPFANNTTTTPSTGTGSSGGRVRAAQMRQRKRAPRPSFNIHGNIFAKTRRFNQQDGELRDLNRRKAHRRRLELFNELRMLQSATPTSGDVTHSDGDLKNNNYTSFNYNRPRKSSTIVICKKSIGAGIKCETFDIKSHKLSMTINDEMIVEEENDFFTPKLNDVDDDDDDEISMKPSAAEFDSKMIALTSDFETEQGDGQCFEKLLTETKSSAPFVVKHIEFACDIVPPNNTNNTNNSNTNSNSNNSNSNKNITPTNSTNSHSQSVQSFNGNAQACSTKHGSVLQKSPSPNKTDTGGGISSVNSIHLSHTIYGGSIIHRRLPHVNTTTVNVRKSSIYFKNKNSKCGDDITLITDQTITIMDLVRMWRQMNFTARTLIVFLSMATVTSSLLIAFLLRY